MDLNQRESKSSVLFEFDQDADHFGNQVWVRFRVRETELLVGTNEGLPVPGILLLIPAFATIGLACLRVCKQVGRAALELDDYGHELLFQMKNDNVLVCSTMLRTTITVDFQELFEAWQAFVKKVKHVVISRHPEKVDYGYWPLIDHYPDSALEQYLTLPSWFYERKDCF